MFQSLQQLTKTSTYKTSLVATTKVLSFVRNGYTVVDLCHKEALECAIFIIISTCCPANARNQTVTVLVPEYARVHCIIATYYDAIMTGPVSCKKPYIYAQFARQVAKFFDVPFIGQ